MAEPQKALSGRWHIGRTYEYRRTALRIVKPLAVSPVAATPMLSGPVSTVPLKIAKARRGERMRLTQSAQSVPVAPAWMTAHDREHYWRSRGEQAIRDEMDRAVARRFPKGFRNG